MRKITKILIGLGITFVIFVAGPLTVAAASGQSEALQGLIETYSTILKVHGKTLSEILEVWKEFLAAI